MNSLRDSASDIGGHMLRHKCSEYEFKNGFIINENNELVACERLSPEEEEVFLRALDGKIEENRALRQQRR